MSIIGWLRDDVQLGHWQRGMLEMLLLQCIRCVRMEKYQIAYNTINALSHRPLSRLCDCVCVFACASVCYVCECVSAYMCTTWLRSMAGSELDRAMRMSCQRKWILLLRLLAVAYAAIRTHSFAELNFCQLYHHQFIGIVRFSCTASGSGIFFPTESSYCRQFFCFFLSSTTDKQSTVYLR